MLVQAPLPTSNMSSVKVFRHLPMQYQCFNGQLIISVLAYLPPRNKSGSNDIAENYLKVIEFTVIVDFLKVPTNFLV